MTTQNQRPVRLVIQVLWAPAGTPTELIMDLPRSSWELMSWEADRKQIALPALWRSWINPHVRRVRQARHDEAVRKSGGNGGAVGATGPDDGVR